MKTKATIKFYDGDIIHLDEVHTIILDSQSTGIKDDETYVLIDFTDNDKGSGLFRAKKEYIKELHLELYDDNSLMA